MASTWSQVIHLGGLNIDGGGGFFGAGTGIYGFDSITFQPNGSATSDVFKVEMNPGANMRFVFGSDDYVWNVDGIQINSNTAIRFAFGSSVELGFFGSAPVAKQTCPTNTLAEVLTALRNLGLVA